MSLFSWNNALTLGHPQIDQEHRHLFLLAGKLHDAMLAGKGSTVVRTLLDDLAAYTHSHFQHEETLMRTHRYPNQTAHVEEHRKLTDTVRNLQQKAAQGQLNVTVEVMHFLKDWLDTHIQGSDRLVAAHIGGRR